MRRCLLFVQESKKLSERVTTNTWASELTPWETLSECGRELFGNRWAFCVLASAAAGIVSREKQAQQTGELFNASVPIVRRARHARINAGRLRWWHGHISSASEQMDIAFVLLLLFRWAGRTVIFGMREEIERKLSELQVDWWRKLHGALENQIWFDDRRRTITTNGEEFGKEVSSRFLAAVWYRMRERSRRYVFQKHLRDYAGDDPVVLEFCQDVALGMLFGGESEEWRSRLPGISERYRMGVNSSIRLHVWGYAAYRGRFSLDVAEEILEKSERYPMALISGAQRVVRVSRVSESVVPVGKVAEKRRWFDGI